MTLAASTPLLQLTRRYGLIALMLFVFAGVQVVQASPLHDHAQHTVDCGLWHVPVTDASEASAALVPDYVARGVVVLPTVKLFVRKAGPSPYQGRAPPISLSRQQ